MFLLSIVAGSSRRSVSASFLYSLLSVGLLCYGPAQHTVLCVWVCIRVHANSLVSSGSTHFLLALRLVRVARLR